MLKINNNSDKLIIILHEIYGINKHIKDICHLLANHQYDIICPNLINRNFPFDYSQESIAYQHFIENIGLTTAAEKIKSIIRTNEKYYKDIYIVGFSIGASIAWLCSEENALKGIVGYYGSRIRDHLNIIPCCPVLLFFPNDEPSFDVGLLISYLSRRNFSIQKFPGKHGFCDSYSPAYDRDSAIKSLQMTKSFLSTKN